MIDRIILTDVDGVLVNWFGPFEKYMIDAGAKLAPDSEHNYMISARFDFPVETTQRLAVEFNQSQLIKSLPEIHRSVEFVKKLHEDHKFKFIAVSSVGDYPSTLQYRTENLQTLFGNIFSEVICLPIASNKYDTLTRWLNSDFFWIEDHAGQAMAGKHAGLRPILINDPTNHAQQNKLIPRVNNWEEIYNIICDDYGIECERKEETGYI